MSPRQYTCSRRGDRGGCGERWVSRRLARPASGDRLPGKQHIQTGGTSTVLVPAAG